MLDATMHGFRVLQDLGSLEIAIDYDFDHDESVHRQEKFLDERLLVYEAAVSAVAEEPGLLVATASLIRNLQVDVAQLEAELSDLHR